MGAGSSIKNISIRRSDSLIKEMWVEDFNPNAIPEVLKKEKRWVVYKLNAEGAKVPFNADNILLENSFASSSDPSTWTTFEKALQYFNHYVQYSDNPNYFVLSLGFEMLGSDLIFLDIDCHSDGVESSKKEEVEKQFRAMKTAASLFHTYGERSISGTGLHYYFIGKMNPDFMVGKSTVNPTVEIYDGTCARGVIFTGQKVNDFDISSEEREIGGIQNWQKRFFTPKTAQQVDWESKPIIKPSATPQLSDEEVLSVALKNKKFNLLWNDRWQEALKANGTHYSSQHYADYAFMQSLYFWTGGNEEQTLRLYRQSPCYQAYGKNGKWTKYEKDISKDLEKVKATCKTVYKPTKRITDSAGLQNYIGNMKINI